MRYQPMKDYEIDSIKRDISKSISSNDSSSDVKQHIESAIQELKRALSSLERNTDNRIRELEKNVSSSRNSYSYSSYSSGIRDDRRNIDNAITKISTQLNKLSGGRSFGYSSNYDTERKLNTLVEALKKANSELQSANRNIDTSSKENQELRRKVGGIESDIAKMAAAAAMASAVNREELNQAQYNAKEIIAQLKSEYEGEIRTLRESLSEKVAENNILSAKIASIERLDADNWMPQNSNISPAESYAILWNDILNDDVIELREIRHIQKWLNNNKLDTPESIALSFCCEVIIDRGKVLPDDAQTLYDCSFRLLKSLGAKLME